jgi:hypothetical protein
MSLSTTSQPTQASTSNIIAAQAPAVAARAEINAKATWLAPAAMLVVFAAVHLLTLMDMPIIEDDEAWNANRTWGLLHTFRAYGSMDSGVFENYAGYWTYFPWLGTAIHAIPMWLLGPTLFAMRVTSLIFGLGLLLAVYTIGCRLYNRNAGLLAMGIAGLSTLFAYSAHMGRHDIIAAAMGYGAIALYLGDKAEGFSARALAAGLLVGLTIEFHMYGLLFAPALCLLYLLRYRLGIIRALPFWSFMAGIACSLALWAALHILPYPGTYTALFALSNGVSRDPSAFQLNPVAWANEIVTTTALFGLHTNALFYLSIIAFVGLLIRRSDSDKKVLVLVSVLFLGFALLVRIKMPWYMIQVVPALCLLVAAYIAKLIDEPWRSSRLAFMRLAVAATLALVSVSVGATQLLSKPMTEYDSVAAQVRAAIPAGKSVMGSPTYWFGLPQETYYCWVQLPYYQRYKPDSAIDDALAAIRPDYLVIDREMEGSISSDSEMLARSNATLVLDKSRLDSFLEKQATLVSRFQTDTFGTIRIYRLNW